MPKPPRDESPKKTPKDATKQKPRRVPAPKLPYEPRDPERYRPAIGLVGCGGIAKWHLTAYRNAKYNVVALCDIDRDRADERRKQYYPDADVYDDHHELLARDDIEVVDITTHPPQRPPIVEAAIRAHKHVLSQKPFVTDLEVGERLADLAEAEGVKLAVNQNARWAPHFSYVREAVRAGVLGLVDAVHCDIHWDHSWIKGGPFEDVEHLILYDFAIHWFDFLATIMANSTPRRVYASVVRASTQTVRPALLGQAMIEYHAAQASFAFDGFTQFDKLDRTIVVGSQGVIRSTGPTSETQSVELITEAGIAQPELTGAWFPDGFHGTMAELLCAIEENREPTHSARNNLKSLALCFAAVASAERGEPVVPGTVLRLPGS